MCGCVHPSRRGSCGLFCDEIVSLPIGCGWVSLTPSSLKNRPMPAALKFWASLASLPPGAACSGAAAACAACPLPPSAAPDTSSWLLPGLAGAESPPPSRLPLLCDMLRPGCGVWLRRLLLPLLLLVGVALLPCVAWRVSRGGGLHVVRVGVAGVWAMGGQEADVELLPQHLSLQT